MLAHTVTRGFLTPNPPKYVKSWPFEGFGVISFTYFGGPGAGFSRFRGAWLQGKTSLLTILPAPRSRGQGKRVITLRRAARSLHFLRVRANMPQNPHLFSQKIITSFKGMPKGYVEHSVLNMGGS